MQIQCSINYMKGFNIVEMWFFNRADCMLMDFVRSRWGPSRSPAARLGMTGKGERLRGLVMTCKRGRVGKAPVPGAGLRTGIRDSHYMNLLPVL
jgi:hypothetical protein